MAPTSSTMDNATSSTSSGVTYAQSTYAGRRSRAFLQERAQAAARRVPRRREAEQDACQDGDEHGEREHAPVERDLRGPRDVALARASAAARRRDTPAARRECRR